MSAGSNGRRPAPPATPTGSPRSTSPTPSWRPTPIDGIAIPANSIIGSDNWSKVGGGFVDRSHSALSDQATHKVFGAPAYISATNPASLAEATLNGATVTVSLGGTVPLAPTDEAPSFGGGSVPAKTFFRTRAIAEFQVPAATGGNGALAYTVSGLPAGLVFDADGTGSCPRTEPREVCGTPTATTSGARTVTVTAQDADANRAAGDRDTLTFQVTVFDIPTVAANPATLTEANLDGAALT